MNVGIWASGQRGKIRLLIAALLSASAAAAPGGGNRERTERQRKMKVTQQQWLCVMRVCHAGELPLHNTEWQCNLIYTSNFMCSEREVTSALWGFHICYKKLWCFRAERQWSTVTFVSIESQVCISSFSLSSYCQEWYKWTYRQIWGSLLDERWNVLTQHKQPHSSNSWRYRDPDDWESAQMYFRSYISSPGVKQKLWTSCTLRSPSGKNSNNPSIHKTNLVAVEGLEATLSISSLSLSLKSFLLEMGSEHQEAALLLYNTLPNTLVLAWVSRRL